MKFACALVGIQGMPPEAGSLFTLTKSMVIPFTIEADNYEEAEKRAERFKEEFRDMLAEHGPFSLLQANWQAWFTDIATPIAAKVEYADLQKMVASLRVANIPPLTEVTGLGCPDLS